VVITKVRPAQPARKVTVRLRDDQDRKVQVNLPRRPRKAFTHEPQYVALVAPDGDAAMIPSTCVLAFEPDKTPVLFTWPEWRNLEPTE
jgi:hypothetical protein